MIGVVGALVKVLINSSSECFQGWTLDRLFFVVFFFFCFFFFLGGGGGGG